jgi:hypothetical protein
MWTRAGQSPHPGAPRPPSPLRVVLAGGDVPVTARWCAQCEAWLGDIHSPVVLAEHQADHAEMDDVCECDHVRALHTDRGECVAASGCGCGEWRPV